MKIITRNDVEKNVAFYSEEIKKGRVFVYPTDTIYGIGCDASHANGIRHIRFLKKRDTKPFSVIAPTKKWIRERCIVSEKCEQFLRTLPGPYTLIFQLRNSDDIAKTALVGDADTLGVRMPDHWFARFLFAQHIAFVTTSVNISGEKPLVDVKDLTFDVDYVIDDGMLDNAPSTLVNCVTEEIVERTL